MAYNPDDEHCPIKIFFTYVDGIRVGLVGNKPKKYIQHSRFSLVLFEERFCRNERFFSKIDRPVAHDAVIPFFKKYRILVTTRLSLEWGGLEQNG